MATFNVELRNPSGTFDIILSSAASNPKISTLTESWDNLAAWSTPSGSALSVSGGNLVVNNNTTGTSSMTSVDVYDFTNSNIVVPIEWYTSSSITGDMWFVIQTATTEVVKFDIQTDEFIPAIGTTTGSIITLRKETMRNIRFRESSGTTYIEFSPDGDTWVTIQSGATPTDATSVEINIGFYSDSALSDSVLINPLNVSRSNMSFTTSGLFGWWKVDTPNTALTDNTAMTSQSLLNLMRAGSANLSVINTGLGPVYRSSLSLLNNKPALEFNRSTPSQLGFTDVTPFNNVTGGTIFVAAVQDNTVGYQVLVHASRGDDAGRTRFGIYANDGVPELGARRLDADTYAALTGSGTPLTTSEYARAVMDWSTGNGSLAFNGIANASGSITSSGSTSATSPLLFSIGCDSDISVDTDGFDGWIAEILVYERVLTSTEIAEVEAYLAAKYVPPPVIPTTGLWGWWRANDLVLSNTAPVTSWTDIQNGRVLDSTNATAPTFSTNQINGLPALSFTRSHSPTDRLLQYNTPLFDGVDGGTVFFLIKQNNATTNQRILFVTTATDGATRLLIGTNTSGQLEAKARRLDADTQVATVGGTAGLSSYGILTTRMNWSTGRVDQWVNGVNKTGVSSFTTSGTTSATNAAGFYIGATNDATANATGVDGYIAEIIIYERSLSDPEVATVEAYLNEKYFNIVAPSAEFSGWGIPMLVS